MNSDQTRRILCDFLSKSQPINQIVNFPTRNNKVLDVILTNVSDRFSNIVPLPPLGNSDHTVVKCSFVQFEKNPNIERGDYKIFRKNLKKSRL